MTLETSTTNGLKIARTCSPQCKHGATSLTCSKEPTAQAHPLFGTSSRARRQAVMCADKPHSPLQTWTQKLRPLSSPYETPAGTTWTKLSNGSTARFASPPSRTSPRSAPNALLGIKPYGTPSRPSAPESSLSTRRLLRPKTQLLSSLKVKAAMQVRATEDQQVKLVETAGAAAPTKN